MYVGVTIVAALAQRSNFRAHLRDAVVGDVERHELVDKRQHDPVGVQVGGVDEVLSVAVEVLDEGRWHSRASSSRSGETPGLMVKRLPWLGAASVHLGARPSRSARTANARLPAYAAGSRIPQT